jgi:TonB family protein
MSSHSISLGNNRSDLQFIGDLINLCKRHQISCGDPQDLNHLSSDILFNEEFRVDLFTLCTVISHMTEVEPSPEQLLVLVARALGGPGISPGKANVDIPHAASSAFLKGYESWSKHEPDHGAASPRPTDQTPTPSQPIPPQPITLQPRATPYSIAASRSSDFHGPQEVPPAGNSTTGEPSRRSIPSNSKLENLTLSELKMYLEEIESRVTRIEPHVEKVAPQQIEKSSPQPIEKKNSQPYFSPEYFERLEALDAQRALRAKATAAAAAAQYHEVAVPPLSIIPTSQVEPDPLPPPLVVHYPEPVVSSLPSFHETPRPAFDAASVRKLRLVNALLACFLFIAGVSAVIFAYRYLHPPPTFTDTISRYPVPLGGEPSSTADPEDSTTAPVPAPARSSVIAVPADARNTHPVQISPNPTSRSKSNGHSVSQVNPQAYMDRPTYVVSLSPNAPAFTPSNATVTVPPATMMTYAISTPKPSYPSNRYGDSDSTVDVEATISKDGRVTSARALTGTFDVRNAAVQAVLGWRFKPFVFNGYPVTVVTTFEFDFKGK